jgi:hypothetical protein
MDVFEALLKQDPGLTLFDPDNDYMVAIHGPNWTQCD